MPAELRAEPGTAGVWVLTLSHPERKGALNHALLEALEVQLDLAVSDGARVLLLRGEGGAFSAGYDLGNLDLPDQGGALPDAYLEAVMGKLERLPLPTIAQVAGPAFGAGCELACACDFRVGDGCALFCMPPARLGIVYSLDGLARVARLVGLQRARKMALTACRVGADEAHAWGLLDVRAPDGQAAAQAEALAAELGALAPLALRGMKRGLALLGARALEAERAELDGLRRRAFESADAAEGIAAFLERRAPKFSGR